MKAIDALLELLNRVGACQDRVVLVSNEQLHQWPAVAVKAIKSQKLIARTRPASSMICPACESQCVMPVHSLPAPTGKASSFIVCDKRSDINRVHVPADRLIQWQCNADLLSGFVASCLALHHNTKRIDDVGRHEIGVVIGNKRSQMLCLEIKDTVNLIIGHSTAPLAEFIEFHDRSYSLDVKRIRQLVDSSTTADERYTPNNARQEARKLDTQSMYERWRKEYRALSKRRPEMSDRWCSQQIARMEIAQGRDAETIRKHMKK